MAKLVQEKGRELVAAVQEPQEHPAFRGRAHWVARPRGISETRHQQKCIASHVRIASPRPGHPELVGVGEGQVPLDPGPLHRALAGGLLAS